MAITNWSGDETPMPAVAYQQPAQSGQFDRPGGGIDAGFGQDSSFRVPPQNSDGAAIDRHVVPARTESGTGVAHSSDPGDRFATVDRHII